jgi:hypothetical protein
MKSINEFINEKLKIRKETSSSLDIIELFSKIMNMDYSKSEEDFKTALEDFSKKCISNVNNIEIATIDIDSDNTGTFIIKSVYPEIELEKIGKSKFKEFEKKIYSNSDDVIEVDFENNHIDQYLMLNYGLNMLIYTSNEGGFILKA